MDWDNYRSDDKYFEKPAPSTTFRYFKIGFGLMLGLIAAWLIYMLIVGSIMVSAAKEFQRETVTILKTDTFKIQREYQSKVEQQRLEQEWKRQQAIREKTDQQRQQYETLLADKVAREEKEIAWERFYRKPTECENPQSNELFIECTNQFIRAKTMFDKKWRSHGR